MLVMADLDLVLKRSATIPLKILDKLLMVIGDVDIGPRPVTISPITHVTMLYCFVDMFILVVSMIFFMTMK